MGIFDKIASFFKGGDNTNTSAERKADEGLVIKSIVNGKIVDITEVPDQVFSAKMMGEGVAVEVNEKVVVSPVTGKIESIFATNHAITLTSEDGVNLLVHIGLDTVQLEGKGFERVIEEGAQVKAGEPIMKVDPEFIKGEGKQMITPIIVMESDNYEIEKVLGDAKAGDVVMKLKKK